MHLNIGSVVIIQIHISYASVTSSIIPRSIPMASLSSVVRTYYIKKVRCDPLVTRAASSSKACLVFRTAKPHAQDPFELHLREIKCSSGKHSITYPLFDTKDKLLMYSLVNGITVQQAAIAYKAFYNIIPFEYHISEQLLDLQINGQQTNNGLCFATAEKLTEYAVTNNMSEFETAVLFRVAVPSTSRKTRSQAAFEIYKTTVKAYRLSASSLKSIYIFENSDELAVYACNNYITVEQAALAPTWVEKTQPQSPHTPNITHL